MGVAPRNFLTDLHKIWHGWLHRGCHSIPQVACQLVLGVTPMKGWNVNGYYYWRAVCTIDATNKCWRQ